MRILMLAPTYVPEVGGAEAYAKYLCEGLVQRGHLVTVFTDGSREQGPEREMVNGVQVVRAGSYRGRLNDPARGPWRQLQFAILDDLVECEPPEIVHANSYEAAIYGTIAALHHGSRLVCTLHEQTPEEDTLGRGRCGLVYRHLPVDCYIAPSEFYENKARAFGAAPEHVRRIGHGIDIARFAQSVALRNRGRSRIGGAEGDHLIVCAGRIYERKGQKYLAQAFEEIHRAHPSARLALIGPAGPASYVEAIWDQISSAAARERVTLHQGYGPDDMAAVFAAADVVVQPSLAEGFGLAVAEAFAAGRPVIGTDVSGLREVISSGRNGLLVPPANAPALAAAVVALAKDPARAAALGRQAQADAAERYSIERMVSETEAAYQSVLDSNSRHDVNTKTAS